jgi:hypothetical protein
MLNVARGAHSTTASLQDAMRRETWKSNLISYIHVMTGLHAATRSEWWKVKDCLQRLDERMGSNLEGSFALLAAYLQGVYNQGVGNLDIAIREFEHPQFAIDEAASSSNPTRQVERMVSILASMNKLMILQSGQFKDDEKATLLMEQLEHICADHPDEDIQTAYHLVMAACKTIPPWTMNQIKRHISHAVNGGQRTNNTHCLSMSLNLMRYLLFEGVLGEQAMKSAKAGEAQAKKSGNLLWMSVAGGMLAQTLEDQSMFPESKEIFAGAVRAANESWDRTQLNGASS